MINIKHSNLIKKAKIKLIIFNFKLIRANQQMKLL